MTNKTERLSKSTQGRGQGIVEYAIIAALVALVVIGGLALTGESTGGVYQKVIDAILGDQEEIPQTTPEPTPIPEDLTVHVRTPSGDGIASVKVLAFNAGGNHVQSASTDGSGDAVFSNLDPGSYKFRADFKSQEYWSGVVSYPGQTSTTIVITERDVHVKVVDARGGALADVNVHAFTGAGHYTAESGKTNQNGLVIFTLPDGSYTFRADYQSQPTWSDTIQTASVTSVEIRIPEAPFTVRVHNRQGKPVEDVPVYAFNSNSGYTGISGRTGEDGTVEFDLPNGEYKFRADFQSQAYWSPAVTTPDSEATSIEVGGAEVTVRVVEQDGDPVHNMRVFAYKDDQYTGDSAKTSKDGTATFELTDGNYTFRTDYKGNTFWSNKIQVPNSNSATIKVGKGGLTVSVVDQSGKAISGIYVYFTFR